VPIPPSEWEKLFHARSALNGTSGGATVKYLGVYGSANHDFHLPQSKPHGEATEMWGQ